MEVISPNGVKIYNVSVGKSNAQFVKQKKKKGQVLKKNKIEKASLELIQDFHFPASASKIKTTNDGLNIMATGGYPPMIKVYETDDMSLKFKRHLDCDVVNFEILTDDFSKIIFLRADRYIEFHARFGTYYSTRIPVFGRDLSYHYSTCDLFSVGASPYVFRLNLEQGRFLKPYTSSSEELSKCTVNSSFGILATGSTDGVVECWDPRDRSHLSVLKVAHQDIPVMDYGVSALNFSDDGLTLAVGTTTGHCLLYDLRKKNAYQIKDHQFDVPIVDIKFHKGTKNVVSSCKKIIRVWDKDTGKSFFNIQTPWDINDVSIVGDSGMFLVAGDNPRMNIYYIPELGRAPQWCSFLDNITEELENDPAQESEYQDFKFVTKEDLESLGATHLVGTPYLKAYMHGFFMDFRLYRKLSAVSNPTQYQDYIKERIAEKIAKKRSSRISLSNKRPKVNSHFAEHLAEKKGEERVKRIMEDERFGRLWADPAMNVKLRRDDNDVDLN